MPNPNQQRRPRPGMGVERYVDPHEIEIQRQVALQREVDRRLQQAREDEQITAQRRVQRRQQQQSHHTLVQQGQYEQAQQAQIAFEQLRAENYRLAQENQYLRDNGNSRLSPVAKVRLRVAAIALTVLAVGGVVTDRAGIGVSVGDKQYAAGSFTPERGEAETKPAANRTFEAIAAQARDNDSWRTVSSLSTTPEGSNRPIKVYLELNVDTDEDIYGDLADNANSGVHAQITPVVDGGLEEGETFDADTLRNQLAATLKANNGDASILKPYLDELHQKFDLTYSAAANNGVGDFGPADVAANLPQAPRLQIVVTNELALEGFDEPALTVDAAAPVTTTAS